jgi:hypothetical protein
MAKDSMRRLAAIAASAARTKRMEARREAERRVVQRWAKRRNPEQIAQDTGVSLDGPKDRGNGKPAVWKKTRYKSSQVRVISTGIETNRRKH